MNLDRTPLPRFWYLPRGEKAAVVMTGDDHASDGGTVGRFETFEAASPPGCSVARMAVRAIDLVRLSQHDQLTDADAAGYQADGVRDRAAPRARAA